MSTALDFYCFTGQFFPGLFQVFPGSPKGVLLGIVAGLLRAQCYSCHPTHSVRALCKVNLLYAVSFNEMLRCTWLKCFICSRVNNVMFVKVF